MSNAIVLNRVERAESRSRFYPPGLWKKRITANACNAWPISLSPRSANRSAMRGQAKFDQRKHED
ncbi:MAG: hypothetical protein HYX63_20055 [Gammaproteobacteria bacterium]|nr:hypothetical protein [Gammaproteobacteria bacterium]